jgi:hypothetical protein
MHFEKFSFGSICIDGTTYNHDVVIDRARSADAKMSRPKSSAMLSDTCRSPQTRPCLGNAARS